MEKTPAGAVASQGKQRALELRSFWNLAKEFLPGSSAGSKSGPGLEVMKSAAAQLFGREKLQFKQQLAAENKKLREFTIPAFIKWCDKKASGRNKGQCAS